MLNETVVVRWSPVSNNATLSNAILYVTGSHISSTTGRCEVEGAPNEMSCGYWPLTNQASMVSSL